MVEHPDLRRFIQILSQRQCVLEQEKEEEDDSAEPTKSAIKPQFTSVIQRNIDNAEMRDIFFKIMRLCASFSFGDIMATQEDIERMLKTATLAVTEALNTACFVESKSTKQITTLKWPQGEQSITYRSGSCVITEKEL